ncbi:hypothetical protein MLD38_032543 [Melastoma candidum]|uniref:Uncharacterized protein n=1 Tax=Melastoma candidum TaxID=119954 RepID=A0ACB9M7K4_9MYRT|nr:hypothetical protein MLD38_032543 [Melastoma candidum]
MAQISESGRGGVDVERVDVHRLQSFVFACQFLLLQPLVSADGGKSIDSSALLERASQSIKVKRYNEALNDLNAAIQVHPDLSEALLQKASILRQLCRYVESEASYKKFL